MHHPSIFEALAFSIIAHLRSLSQSNSTWFERISRTFHPVRRADPFIHQNNPPSSPSLVLFVLVSATTVHINNDSPRCCSWKESSKRRRSKRRGKSRIGSCNRSSGRGRSHVRFGRSNNSTSARSTPRRRLSSTQLRSVDSPRRRLSRRTTRKGRRRGGARGGGWSSSIVSASCVREREREKRAMRVSWG